MKTSTYYSQLFRDFRAIEPGEWRTIVRFCEEYEKEVEGMEFEERFEVMLAYAKALFEIGDYPKHLKAADAVVEVSVMNNVRFFNGEDVFHNTLFKKAASLYHLHELEKADYILRELLRIDPFDKDSISFLKKCLRHARSNFVRQGRAVAMVLFLASAVVIAFELLWVSSFYKEHEATVRGFRNALFVSGLVVLAACDVFHRWRTGQEVDVFVAGIRRRKK